MENWEKTTATREDAETWFVALQDKLRKVGIRITQDTKILEIGSGEGLLLKLLQEKGFNVVGVDARPVSGGGVREVAARIEQLPFADATFDVVVGVAVFDTFVYDQQQEAMMQEIERVLKPRGIYTGFSNTMDKKIKNLLLISTEEPEGEGVYQKR